MNNYGTEKKLRRQCIDASAAKDLLLFLLYPRCWQVAETFFIEAEGGGSLGPPHRASLTPGPLSLEEG